MPGGAGKTKYIENKLASDPRRVIGIVEPDFEDLRDNVVKYLGVYDTSQFVISWESKDNDHKRFNRRMMRFFKRYNLPAIVEETDWGYENDPVFFELSDSVIELRNYQPIVLK